MGFKVEEKFRIILVMKEVNLTNVKRLCVGGALKHKIFNPPLNLNRITNGEYSR